MGFPGGTVVKNSSAKIGVKGEVLWEDLLEEEVILTPEFLPGKFRGQRSLVGYGLCNHKELNRSALVNIRCPSAIVFSLRLQKKPPCCRAFYLLLF